MKSGTLFTARKTWEVRSHMLDVAGNYPGHRKYEHFNWRCQACNQEVKEDQEHLTLCEGYQELRADTDLYSSTANYFGCSSQIVFVIRLSGYNIFDI